MTFLKLTLDNPDFLQPFDKTLADGTRLRLMDTGILRVSPNCKSNQKVVISSGVHGNETAPMEIVDALVADIESGQLVVACEVLFIVGNPPAVNAEARFVGENLNRLFSGKHQKSKTAEARRAAQLEQVVRDFFNDTHADIPGDAAPRKLHYDLHTAIRGSELEKFAVYPYLHSREWSRSQIAFLESCGIQAVLFSNQPSGTFSYFSSHEFGADAFTIELGKVRKFGENNMANFEKMRAGLASVISAKQSFQRRHSSIKLFSVVEEVIKRTEAFQLHVDDDAKNFTEFSAGVLLASDDGYEYRTQQDGERFVFPISNVPCGQRAMLVVAPTKLT